MTIPKMKPCPRCKTDAYLSIYTYESGWRYVECDGNDCNYFRGPGAGSKLQAVKLHNAAVADRQVSP